MTTPIATAPFAPGSISLRLYPHLNGELDAPGIVAELTGQAALAAASGFDGVMTSEHHGGFAGYLPNPLQAAGWCLEEMATGWAAPCPLLLPLRPAALVAEWSLLRGEGGPELRPRWKHCVDATARTFGAAVGVTFARRNLGAGGRERAARLVAAVTRPEPHPASSTVSSPRSGRRSRTSRPRRSIGAEMRS